MKRSSLTPGFITIILSLTCLSTLLISNNVGHAKRSSERCIYGRYPTVYADSCQDVLDVQPNCYGHDGFFWIKNNLLYCDMTTKGGGWQRVVYFHHDTNTTCPQSGCSRMAAHHFNSMNSTYCGSSAGNNDYCSECLLSGSSVFASGWFTSVRGYVNLRVGIDPNNSNTTVGLAGFSTSHKTHFCDGQFSGFYIYPEAGYTRQSLRRTYKHRYPIVVYVLTNPSESSTSGCPSTTAAAKSAEFRRYRYPGALGGYQCDEFDPTGAVDSDNILTKEFFTYENCSQCDRRGKWFEQIYSNPITNNLIWGLSRTSKGNYVGEIYVTDLEIYVR